MDSQTCSGTTPQTWSPEHGHSPTQKCGLMCQTLILVVMFTVLPLVH